MKDETTQTCLLSLKGLHCAACVNRVETSLNKKNGVISASVNLATQEARVEYEDAVISEEDLKNTVIESGYEVIEIDSKKKLRT